MDKPTPSLSCSRCGNETDRLYTIKIKDEDEYGDEKESEMKVCWDCDWDIMNGRGEVHDDAGDILFDRACQAYEYDPINEVRPY